MNKKATFSDLKTIILILIAGLVLFAVIFLWTGVIDNASSKSVCALSFVGASMTKIAGAEGFSIHCPMEEVNITLSSLERKEAEATKYINSYDGTFIARSGLEFALNKEIGTRMAQAWKDSGEGKLDLFSSYWMPVECRGKEKTEPCKIYKPWDWTIDLRRPVNCVIFTRFKFDKDLIKKINDPEKINSLNEWLKKNKVPGRQGISYYDYLLDDGQPTVFKYDLRYSIKEPLAIVFVRINNFQGEGVTKWILNEGIETSVSVASLGLIKVNDVIEQPKAKSYILLIPYDEVALHCTEIMN